MSMSSIANKTIAEQNFSFYGRNAKSPQFEIKYTYNERV